MIFAVQKIIEMLKSDTLYVGNKKPAKKEKKNEHKNAERRERKGSFRGHGGQDRRQRDHKRTAECDS